MEPRPSIKARNLQIELSGQTIYRDLSFEIQAGCLAIITGIHSPAWSMLLHTLAGMQPVHRGDIELWGYPISQISRRDMSSNICLVSKKSKPVFDYPVREFILKGCEVRLKPLQAPEFHDQERTDQILRQMQIERLAGRTSDFLNNAEHQKVNLARAFVQNAHLLLLEEPFDTMSVPDQAVIAGMLDDYVHEKKHTVLASIQDSGRALRLADQLLIFDAHGLVASLERRFSSYDSAAEQILAGILPGSSLNAHERTDSGPKMGPSGQPF